METPATIRLFWFGNSSDDAQSAKEQAGLWWSKNSDTDATIRQRFAVWIDAAGNGELNSWMQTPEGVLALILLTDQFPRNAYRDHPRAFAFDDAARRFCRAGLERHADAALRPIERVFHYLPLEHSERLEDQQEAIRLIGALVDQAAPEDKALFSGYLDFAMRHCDVVSRFGRFPHRNAILGRASTAREAEYLGQPGSGF